MPTRVRPYRLVIKLGTNVLTADDGRLDLSVFQSIVDQVAELKTNGHQAIIVSSGAVGAGESVCPPLHLEDEAVRRQVLSAIGQVKLMGLYADLFAEKGLLCAQVLATKEDFTRGRESHRNMQNCLAGLLKDEIIPIVNENDVVSLTELMFTDNDELAALTAQMIEAHKLILLSNIDGLFSAHPSEDGSRLIEQVLPHDRDVFECVSPRMSRNGRGGMESKLRTAMHAAANGIETHLANGKRQRVVLDILAGERLGTIFPAQETLPAQDASRFEG